MSALLPCPFCGGEAKTVFRGAPEQWVSCHVCNASGPMRDASKTAIAAWNRRTPPNDWQPIETAPRNGTTEIDIWVGRWRDGSDRSEQAAWRMPEAYWDASMEMWCSETAHIAVPDDCATHWRPITPPEKQP